MDGTKIDKVFESGGSVSEAESFDWCKALCACLRCKCSDCPKCPKCPGCCDCCKSSHSSDGQESKYELQARTVKALQEIIFTDAKL